MQSRTRKLAARVQRALLALTDDVLQETIAHWLLMIQEHQEDIEIQAEYCEPLGYHIQSETTRQMYDSLEALTLAEPDAENVLWVPPEASLLRELVRRKQPKQIYHQIVALAGEAMQAHPFAFQWGEPPGEHSDGYPFMEALAAYVTLKQQAGSMSTEQFEETYEAQLETLGESRQENIDDLSFLKEMEFTSSSYPFSSHKKQQKSRQQKHRSGRR